MMFIHEIHRRRLIGWVFGVVVVALLLACGFSGSKTDVSDEPGEGDSRTCTASYFGGPEDRSVGPRMANGEPFDWHKDLVAHRTLPFESLLTITYEGKTVAGVPV